MHLLESQNLYPDCLLMQLNLKPTESDKFDLELNLSFNEQWQSLLNGRLKFGLKGGQFSLNLNNAKIYTETPEFGQVFNIILLENHNNLSWRLALKTSHSVFKGNLEAIKLGSISPEASPVNLTAIFTVSVADISLTDAEGLWKHDISPNKHAILERKLAQFLWKTKFNPYVSRVQWGTENAQLQPKSSPLEESSLSRQDLEELQGIIDTVYGAKTDNFLELAKIAQLNPLKDLAGGNLLGVELSGVDLSCAILSQVNLRGADLTDADLSEADLENAKLSGADLSGAYLSNTNFRNANLHKASLALANLIGADLREANLVEVNLSQANLSAAEVQGARFGDNPGLTSDMLSNLQKRGAVISQQN